jgi:hypothetical protein
MSRLEHVNALAMGLNINHQYGAFLNPPFVALAAAPLTKFSYPTALAIWAAILLACLAASIVMMVRLLPRGSGWKRWGLVPLLLLGALPVWQAMMHAQNTFISLVILCGVVHLWRAKKPFAAGCLAGLLLFKPQLGVVLAIALVASQGWRAARGLALTTLTLMLVTIVVMPAALASYLHELPPTLAAVQALQRYAWHRHITLLAFWRLDLQGHVGALPNLLAKSLAIVCEILLGGFFVKNILAARRDERRTDRLIAASIAVTPLLSAYYMDYDMTLLAVAAVLAAAEGIRRGVDKKVLAAWIALYLAMEVNPTIGGILRVPIAPPVLAALCMILIERLGRRAAGEAAPLEFPVAAAQTRVAA